MEPDLLGCSISPVKQTLIEYVKNMSGGFLMLLKNTTKTNKTKKSKILDLFY